MCLHCFFINRSFADRQRRDEEVKATISEKLIQSGEKERLKEFLRQKLIECGWRDEMKVYCKGIDSFTTHTS
jgi:enhancer of yellow 2 transcription factor